jgi:hypothetical protein
MLINEYCHPDRSGAKRAQWRDLLLSDSTFACIPIFRVFLGKHTKVVTQPTELPLNQ